MAYTTYFYPHKTRHIYTSLYLAQLMQMNPYNEQYVINTTAKRVVQHGFKKTHRNIEVRATEGVTAKAVEGFIKEHLGVFFVLQEGQCHQFFCGVYGLAVHDFLCLDELHWHLWPYPLVQPFK